MMTTTFINAAGRLEYAKSNPAFSGSVSDFGIWNCIKTEHINFHDLWEQKRRRREKRKRGRGNYESWPPYTHADRRIDVTKGKLQKMWLLGVLGTLGLHYFSVGRIVSGLLRLLYCAAMLALAILVAVYGQAAHPLRVAALFAVFLLTLPLIDLHLITLGKFRDVFRNHIVCSDGLAHINNKNEER